MKKKTKRLLILAAVILVLGALIGGYFLLINEDDALKIKENGKLSDFTQTRLVARFSKGGGEEKYYKVADVSQQGDGRPKGFEKPRGSKNKIDDPDGDPLTNYFAYVSTEGAKKGLIVVDAIPAEDAQPREGDEFLELNGQAGWARYEKADGKRTLEYLMDSLYDEAKIRLRITLPAGATDEELLALCEFMAGKITPDRKVSPIIKDFRRNFVTGDRWKFLWNGLLVTLEITLFAVLIGIALGSVVATVRSTWDQNGENMRRGPARFFLSLGDRICRVYLTVIRGTPVLIQLMIMYFIVFASSDNGKMVAVLAFGINSGAYVAEIIRGGIMSIDKGQLEAGRSLGFNYVQTMGHIILPQALKNVLPALANEFIVLLKETSVVGYVAEKDLTKGGDIIRSVTHSPFLPLLAVAAIYLILVMFFTWLVGRLERRLRSSDH